MTPRLIIALRRDARAALEYLLPTAPVLPRPFTRPRKAPTHGDPPLLIFAPHPSWIARQPRQHQDDAYVDSLATALRWVSIESVAGTK